MASFTFCELPDVEMPMSTSPERPYASTQRAKTFSNPMSFPPAVMMEGSTVNAIAGIAARFTELRNLTTNSAARCWLSAALPPFPQNITLPPAFNFSASSFPVLSMASD